MKKKSIMAQINTISKHCQRPSLSPKTKQELKDYYGWKGQGLNKVLKEVKYNSVKHIHFKKV